MDLVGDWHRALVDAGIAVDFVHPEADLSRYRVLLAPNLYLVSDAAAAGIESFVDRGGRLVLSYFSGIVDEHDHVRLGGYPAPFREVLGLVVEEFTVRPAGQEGGVSWSGTSYPCSTWADVVTTAGADPSTVLMIILENYVTDEDLQRAFAATKTEDYAATLHRGEPLPTLRELIAAGHRLVVFTEEPPTGAVPWLNDAFSYIQDTPLGARAADELRCDRYRGGAGSPFLMLNNWITRFPPSPAAHRPAQTRDFLTKHIARCAERRRLPVSLVATDFYEQGDLIDVARAENARR